MKRKRVAIYSAHWYTLSRPALREFDNDRMDSANLRLLLERCGSYPVIEAAAASGELHELLPVRLFEHIGTIYQRLERAADPDFADIAKLRLAVLLHEEPPNSLPGLLAAVGFWDFAPAVIGVIEGFGKLWRARADHEIVEYVVAQRPHLASLLLFELAHEGRATRQMERAAELGGLALGFKGWVERLSTPAAQPAGWVPRRAAERSGRVR